MNWYIEVLKKYATFSGRARRKEFWLFGLFHILATIMFLFLDGLIGTLDLQSGLGILTSVYILLTAIPHLAVTVRRLHDAGRSGWWYLILLLPLIGPIILLIFCVQNSQPGENQYGINPKDANFYEITGSSTQAVEVSNTRNNTLKGDLEQIKKLFTEGLITEEEYNLKKTQILAL